MSASDYSAHADEFPASWRTSSRAMERAAGATSSPRPAAGSSVLTANGALSLPPDGAGPLDRLGNARASVEALAEWPLDASQPARDPCSPLRAATAGPTASDPVGPAFCLVRGRTAPSGLASTRAGDDARASVEASASPGREGGGLALSDSVLAVLSVVAAHDELSPEGWIARAVTRRADAIGLGPLVDRMQDGPDCAARHGNFAARHCRDAGEGQDDG